MDGDVGVGGIVGCIPTGVVSIQGTIFGGESGGLEPERRTSITVESSSSSNMNGVGGIVGSVSGATNVNISDNKNYADLKINSEGAPQGGINAGGIVGNLLSCPSTVNNNINYGNVSNFAEGALGKANGIVGFYSGSLSGTGNISNTTLLLNGDSENTWQIWEGFSEAHALMPLVTEVKLSHW